MFGYSALIGRRFVHDQKCCCGADFLRGGLPYDAYSRLSCWIDLLRKMTFAITPDVILMYAASTRQRSIVRHILKACAVRTDDEDRPLFEYLYPSESYRASGGNLIFSPPGIMGCRPYGSNYHVEGKDSLLDCPADRAGHVVIPQELTEFTVNYLLDRYDRFVGVILCVLKDAIGYSEGFRSNSLIPKEVYNAISGFNCTMTSPEAIHTAIKALNASVLPIAVYSGSTYNVASLDPGLNWKKGISRPDDRNGKYENWEVVSVEVFQKIKAIVGILGYLKTITRQNLPVDPVEFAPTLEKLSETIADGAEVVLYILAVCADRVNDLHLRNTHEINALCADRGTLARRVAGGNNYDNCTIRKYIDAFAHLSPAAALCCGNTIAPDNNRYSSFGRLFEARLIPLVKKTIETINPRAYGEVVTYLLEEGKYQQSLLERYRRSVVNDPNRGVCEGRG